MPVPLAIPFGLAAALLVSGCTSHLALSPGFGNAVRVDAAAQIADPDAHYLGYPPPGSDGYRAALAEKRYQADKVIRPSVSSTAAIDQVQGGNASAGDVDSAPAPAPQ